MTAAALINPVALCLIKQYNLIHYRTVSFHGLILKYGGYAVTIAR
jgi:hypothetical protein